jgi:hypothetical protein
MYIDIITHKEMTFVVRFNFQLFLGKVLNLRTLYPPPRNIWRFLSQNNRILKHRERNPTTRSTNKDTREDYRAFLNNC